MTSRPDSDTGLGARRDLPPRLFLLDFPGLGAGFVGDRLQGRLVDRDPRAIAAVVADRQHGTPVVLSSLLLPTVA